MSTPRITTKETLQDVAEKLPPDATLSDAISELESRQAVEQDLAELDRGEGIPIEQVRGKIAQWAGRTRLSAPADGDETLLPLAQTAWAADWSTPEEDEAWRAW